MKVLFLHGWTSVVGGRKPTFLKENGHQVLNPALPDDDFEESVRIAESEYTQHRPDVIVGSSRGGAVAVNMSLSDTPLVLLCPAWKNWGTATQIQTNTIILHSRLDDVIPFADSEQLVANSGLSPDSLIEVGNDHRLADEEPLSVMLWACNLLASGEQIPWMENNEQPSGVTASINRKATSQEEASYVCDACGEDIVIPLDLTEGSSQMYVEDCPVCCRANTIHVQIDQDGYAQIWAKPEQDND